MKLCLVIAAVAAAVALVRARPADENVYDDEKIANFDVDELISNDRLLKGYALCFIGRGNCTPDGKNIKKLIPSAIEETCSKCTPRLRSMVRKMIGALRVKLPAEWEELLTVFDPKKQYRAALDKFLEETD